MTQSSNSVKNYRVIVFCWLAMGILSMCANMTGSILPAMISGFRLTLAQAGIMPFAYFAAYAVMSVPAGVLIERIGAKTALRCAFLTACAAALVLAGFPSFATAVAAQFIFGLCMAVVEVAVFPMLRNAGGAENFAFNAMVLALLFAIVSALNPLVYSQLTQALSQPAADRMALIAVMDWLTDDYSLWSGMYWLMAAAFALGAVYLGFLALPRSEGGQVSFSTIGRLLKNRTVLMFFFATFCYVGIEQNCVTWMSKFFQSYYGMDPQTGGARTVAMFWGFLGLGCIPGLLLTKLFDIKKVFGGYLLLAIVFYSLGIFAPQGVAEYAFPFAGFCLSVMWSAIFSLALNSVSEHHEAFSGILCAGVSGGAFFPYLTGVIGDVAGLRAGLCITYIAMFYLVFVCIKARPLVRNRTVRG